MGDDWNSSFPPHELNDSGEKYRKSRIPALNSNWFGTIPAPENFSQFCQILESIAYDYDNVSMWRGQADYRWRLDSGAVRRVRTQTNGIQSDQRSVEQIVAEYERRLINEARCRGSSWIPVPNASDLEVLASLQHYGAATRLLDFSENAFIALWFACSDIPQETGLLFAIDRNIAEPLDQYSEARAELVNILNKSPQRPIYFWRPGYLFDRMRVQQSIFLFNKVDVGPWGSLQLATGVHVPGASEILVIAVTQKLKGAMASMWEILFGYSVQTLFPDLEGFARAHSASNIFPWKL